jgi:hypothetical protein
MLCLRGKPTGSPYPTTPALRFQQAGDPESGLFPQFEAERSPGALKREVLTRMGR